MTMDISETEEAEAAEAAEEEAEAAEEAEAEDEEAEEWLSAGNQSHSATGETEALVEARASDNIISSGRTFAPLIAT